MSQTNSNAAKTILRFVLAATVITSAPDIAANIRLRLIDDQSAALAGLPTDSQPQAPDRSPRPESPELQRERWSDRA
jgi:hypothetical protein